MNKDKMTRARLEPEPLGADITLKTVYIVGRMEGKHTPGKEIQRDVICGIKLLERLFGSTSQQSTSE